MFWATATASCWGQRRFLCKINKAEYIQKVDSIVAELEATNSSPLQTTLQTALDETSKEKQYYLNQDGAVYLKTA